MWIKTCLLLSMRKRTAEIENPKESYTYTVFMPSLLVLSETVKLQSTSILIKSVNEDCAMIQNSLKLSFCRWRNRAKDRCRSRQRYTETERQIERRTICFWASSKRRQCTEWCQTIGPAELRWPPPSTEQHTHHNQQPLACCCCWCYYC